MKSNIQRLGDTITDRMKKTAGASVPTVLELGVINANLSLTTDSLKTPIPKGDYMVSLSLTHKNYFTYNELNSSAKAPHHHSGGDHSHSGCGIGGGHSGGAHTHDDGLHDHRVPSVFRRLRAGDRVLVAWVGNEPIVVDIVVSSNTITEN